VKIIPLRMVGFQEKTTKIEQLTILTDGLYTAMISSVHRSILNSMIKKCVIEKCATSLRIVRSCILGEYADEINKSDEAMEIIQTSLEQNLSYDEMLSELKKAFGKIKTDEIIAEMQKQLDSFLEE